jgi:hypothetical protein
MKLVVIIAVVLTGVAVADAQQGNYVPRGGATAAARSQAEPVQPIPREETPCKFGPITKRITLDEVSEIMYASPTRREAWNAILARPENPQLEPVSFAIAAPDDGLGDGLHCPEGDQ